MPLRPENRGALQDISKHYMKAQNVKGPWMRNAANKPTSKPTHVFEVEAEEDEYALLRCFKHPMPPLVTPGSVVPFTNELYVLTGSEPHHIISTEVKKITKPR